MTVRLKTVAGSNKMVVDQDYHCELPFDWNVTVPEGTPTDGFSIPRPLWWLFGDPFQPRHIEAAIVHDYLCVRSHEQQDYEARVMADAAFFLLMERHGVPYWKRALMYLGVRWWGRLTCFRVKKPKAPEHPNDEDDST